MFLGPFLSSYAAVAGFFGSGIGLENLGFGGWAFAIGVLLGVLVCGVLGLIVAIGASFVIVRTAPRFFGGPY
jgi:hypothetical protein